MKRYISTGITVLGMLAGVTAAAQTPFITIGNPGNSPHVTGHGSVGYVYDLGKYEVTNAEYAAFLNDVAKEADLHGLHKPTDSPISPYGITRTGEPGRYRYAADPGREAWPVNRISWYHAARYANWLTSGDTEKGAYSFTTTTDPETGAITTTDVAIDRESAQSSYGTIYVLPTRDEWYKAAYYDPDRNNGSGGYWMFPTRNNTEPLAEPPPGHSNSANYRSAVPGPEFALPTDAGAYVRAASPYGAFDQAGNYWEWVETFSGHPLRMGGAVASPSRLFGAAYGGSASMSADTRGFRTGFRVARIVDTGSSALDGP